MPIPILTRIRRPRRPAETRLAARVTATTRLTAPNAAPRTIKVVRDAPEPPPRLTRQPDITATAPLRTPSGRPRISKRAALAEVLGPIKAGQALWAPEKLTRAERLVAARIIAEVEEADRG